MYRWRMSNHPDSSMFGQRMHALLPTRSTSRRPSPFSSRDQISFVRGVQLIRATCCLFRSHRQLIQLVNIHQSEVTLSNASAANPTGASSRRRVGVYSRALGGKRTPRTSHTWRRSWLLSIYWVGIWPLRTRWGPVVGWEGARNRIWHVVRSSFLLSGSPPV